MSTSLRWTSADLEVMPDDGKRYEIIDGNLYVSKQPHALHQLLCTDLARLLGNWSVSTGLGTTMFAPGVIFADDADVVPDLVWISAARLANLLRADGHLHGPPELVVEVLSPGTHNDRRDREAKLKLYSRRGVDEYWIFDWRSRAVAIYRRNGEALHLVATLTSDDTLTSPVLPGFAGSLGEIFASLPKSDPDQG
jgi:Uma2 family endonuclease